jgi:hypothetical protein
VAAKGTQAAGQRAAGLCFTLLHGLAGFEGRTTQLLQLPLGGIVGSLQRLGPLSCVPQSGAQAWNCQDKKKSERGMRAL